MNTTEAIYDRAKEYGAVSAVDTAKLVRVRLKSEFPGVRFSVRTHNHAHCSSIYVVWSGDPDRDDVDDMPQPYRSTGYDAAIDLQFTIESFLSRDGRAFFAQTAGTLAIMGDYPARKAFKPCPSAVRAYFMADYIFASRRETKRYPPLRAVGDAHTGDGLPF